MRFADWAPNQLKIFATPIPKFKKFIYLVIFLFNHLKNNAILEPRTENFRKLEGFEAKTKDLSFEAKAKEIKMCSRGRLRELHLG